MGRKVGVYKKGKYKCFSNGKQTREYNLWGGLLTRCYSEWWHERYPTYMSCVASENFKNFQYFAEWCNKQVGFNLPDYQLDKDILIKGNKVYSEDTCVFVPRELNLVLTHRGALRGDQPIGVSLHSRDGCYYSSISIDRKQKHLGQFPTPEEAFLAYKKEKEGYVKLLAERYKDRIDRKTYHSLLLWEVNIND